MTMPSRDTFPELSAMPSATTPRVKTKAWRTWKSKIPTLSTQSSNRRGAIPAPRGDDRYVQHSLSQSIRLPNFNRPTQRGQASCRIHASYEGCEDPTKVSRAEYFRKFFPARWGKQHLLSATNKNLKNNKHAEIYGEEIESWLGLWVMMSLNPS